MGPVLPVFIERYPDVKIDLTATNKMVDIVGDGHDVGILFCGTVPEDMIAQQLSPDIAWAVVATTQYLRRFGIAKHPDDLK